MLTLFLEYEIIYLSLCVKYLNYLYLFNTLTLRMLVSKHAHIVDTNSGGVVIF